MLKFWRSRKKSSQADKAAPARRPRSPASPSSAHQKASPPSSSASTGSTTTPLRGLGLSPLEQRDTVKEAGTSGQEAAAAATMGGARRGSSPRLDEIRPVERAPSEEAIAERPRKVLIDRNGRDAHLGPAFLSVEEATTAAKEPVRRDGSHSHDDDNDKRSLSPRSASQLSVVRDSRSRNTARSYTSRSHEVEEGEGDRDPTQIYGEFMAHLSLSDCGLRRTDECTPPPCSSDYVVRDGQSRLGGEPVGAGTNEAGDPVSVRRDLLRLFGAHRPPELTYVAISPAGKSLRARNGAFPMIAYTREKVLIFARPLPASQIRRRTPLPRRTLLVPASPPALDFLVVSDTAAFVLRLSSTVFFDADALALSCEPAAANNHGEHIERRTPNRFAFLEVAEPATTTTSSTILRIGTRLERARFRARQLLLER
jgi:hypothetical protein